MNLRLICLRSMTLITSPTLKSSPELSEVKATIPVSRTHSLFHPTEAARGGVRGTSCDHFLWMAALLFQQAFVRGPSGLAADGAQAPRMHLRLSARQGREALLAGRDKEKTNRLLKDDDNKSPLINAGIQ